MQTPNIIHLDARQGYDLWSEIYDHELNPLIALESEVVANWLSSVRGKIVADVGCGTGRHSVWLAERGAQVLAFEASDGMRAKAQQKLKEHDISIRSLTLPDPIPIDGMLCDMAVFALVADHIADLTRAFEELSRVLKPGGFVVFTVMHPAMNLKGITARFTHPQLGQEVRVAAHQHTYADYVMAVLKSGLIIEEIVEKRSDQDLVNKAPRAEKYLGWPMLLAMKLSKPSDQ